VNEKVIKHNFNVAITERATKNLASLASSLKMTLNILPALVHGFAFSI